MKKYIQKKASTCKNGFTLVEILFATILIGLAVTALIAANTAFSRSNAAGVTISTAEFLCEQIRELTMTLEVTDPDTGTDVFGAEEAGLAGYDDIDDLDGVAFSPPINISRNQLSQFSAYTQQITVENVNAGNLEQVVADHSSPFVRITVTILYNSRQISSTSWLRALY